MEELDGTERERNFIATIEKTLSMYQSQNHCRVNSQYARHLHLHKTQAQMCLLLYIPVTVYDLMQD